MSPAAAAGRRLRRAPQPHTEMMYRFLAPLLSAQFMVAATGRASDMRNLLPEAPPRARFDMVAFCLLFRSTSRAERSRREEAFSRAAFFTGCAELVGLQRQRQPPPSLRKGTVPVSIRIRVLYSAQRTSTRTPGYRTRTRTELISLSMSTSTVRNPPAPPRCSSIYWLVGRFVLASKCCHEETVLVTGTRTRRGYRTVGPTTQVGTVPATIGCRGSRQVVQRLLELPSSRRFAMEHMPNLQQNGTLAALSALRCVASASRLHRNLLCQAVDECRMPTHADRYHQSHII